MIRLQISKASCAEGCLVLTNIVKSGDDYQIDFCLNHSCQKEVGTIVCALEGNNKPLHKGYQLGSMTWLKQYS